MWCSVIFFLTRTGRLLLFDASPIKIFLFFSMITFPVDRWGITEVKLPSNLSRNIWIAWCHQVQCSVFPSRSLSCVLFIFCLVETHNEGLKATGKSLAYSVTVQRAVLCINSSNQISFIFLAIGCVEFMHPPPPPHLMPLLKKPHGGSFACKPRQWLMVDAYNG